MPAPDGFYELRAFILTQTDLEEIILGFGAGKRPNLPYGTLHCTSMQRLNRPEQVKFYDDTSAGENSEAREEVGVEWEFVWQFDVYGEPGDVFSQLNASKYVPTSYKDLTPYTLHNISAVRFLPEIIDNNYELRANVDITLRAIIHHDTSIDLIETFEDPSITVLPQEL